MATACDSGPAAKDLLAAMAAAPRPEDHERNPAELLEHAVLPPHPPITHIFSAIERVDDNAVFCQAILRLFPHSVRAKRMAGKCTVGENLVCDWCPLHSCGFKEQLEIWQSAGMEFARPGIVVHAKAILPNRQLTNLVSARYRRMLSRLRPAPSSE